MDRRHQWGSDRNTHEGISLMILLLNNEVVDRGTKNVGVFHSLELRKEKED